MQELIAVSPADGFVGGTAEVWGHPVVLAAYDYTVFAGTQGAMNHKKQDRLFSLAAARSLPVVLFAEGGGGRPGDVDVSHSSASQLDVPTFATFARLRERVPLVVTVTPLNNILPVDDRCHCDEKEGRGENSYACCTSSHLFSQGVVSGRCFAGNAVLLACCDIVIATENSNIGLGGPVRKLPSKTILNTLPAASCSFHPESFSSLFLSFSLPSPRVVHRPWFKALDLARCPQMPSDHVMCKRRPVWLQCV
jgi:hypothetical protein